MGKVDLDGRELGRFLFFVLVRLPLVFSYVTHSLCDMGARQQEANIEARQRYLSLLVLPLNLDHSVVVD